MNKTHLALATLALTLTACGRPAVQIDSSAVEKSMGSTPVGLLEIHHANDGSTFGIAVGETFSESVFCGATVVSPTELITSNDCVRHGGVDYDQGEMEFHLNRPGTTLTDSWKVTNVNRDDGYAHLTLDGSIDSFHAKHGLPLLKNGALPLDAQTTNVAAKVVVVASPDKNGLAVASAMDTNVLYSAQGFTYTRTQTMTITDINAYNAQHGYNNGYNQGVNNGYNPNYNNGANPNNPGYVNTPGNFPGGPNNGGYNNGYPNNGYNNGYNNGGYNNGYGGGYGNNNCQNGGAYNQGNTGSYNTGYGGNSGSCGQTGPVTPTYVTTSVHTTDFVANGLLGAEQPGSPILVDGQVVGVLTTAGNQPGLDNVRWLDHRGEYAPIAPGSSAPNGNNNKGSNPGNQGNNGTNSGNAPVNNSPVGPV